ncbi:hypothetical protein NPX99_08055, partial [Bartonella sp. 220]|nr:hypothetical protein [Bartonella sp. 220B]
MKKIQKISAKNDFNISHSFYQRPFLRTLSLAGMVVFLSNIFLVSAGVAGNSSDGKPNTVETASTTSPVDVNASHISGGEASSRFAVSTQPVLVSALESDPAALRVDVSAHTESLEEDTVKKGPRLRSFSLPDLRQISALESDLSALNGDISADDEALEANTVNKGILSRSFSMPDLNQPMARSFTPFSISGRKGREYYGLELGVGAEANHIGTIAIGTSEGCGTDNVANSCSLPTPKANARYSIAVGVYSKVEKQSDYATALGVGAYVYDVEDSVALGAGSNVKAKKGVVGYSPKEGGASKSKDVAWKSTKGSVSIGKHQAQRLDGSGEIRGGIIESRQITGLAAGTEDTDAVNVAQLKELRSIIRGEWQFAVNGSDSTTMNPGDSLDLTAGSENFKIVKGESTGNGQGDKKNKVKFDLAKDLTLDSIKLGASTLDATGLIVADGPKITKDGISAGNKKITNVETGTEDTDAVNVAQLKALQDSITPSWDLSVNGENKTNVNSTSPMDLAAGSTNITLTKGEKDNKVKFDLAKDLELNSIKIHDDIKLGASTLDAAGLIVADGPKMTKDGISAGNKKITGLADGSVDTDAVNFSQLKSAETKIEQQVAANSFVKQDANTKHITIGKGAGGDKIDIANSDKEKRTLTGLKNGDISASSTDAVAGQQLHSLGSEVAKYFGGEAKYDGAKWTAPTFKFKTVKDDGSPEDKTYHNVADAFSGVGSSFTNVNNKITKVESSVTNIHNEITQKIAQNALSWNEKEQAFVATHGDKHQEGSKIKFVIGGDQTSNSTDAVNGGQMYILGTKIAMFLGGGADFGAGNWNGPTFKFKTIKDDGTEEDNTYYNVADAFAGVGTAFTTIQKKVTEQVNNVIQKVEGESVVKWDETTKSITIGQEKDGNIINFQNKNNENRTIAGVIGGKISKDSNEAVNGSQLFDTNEKIAAYFGGDASYKDGSWTAPKFVVKKFNSQNSITDATYGNVAAAFAGIGESFEKVKDSFKEIKDEITTVQGDALLWDKAKSAFVATRGEEDKKTNSKITFLQKGDISKDSTDAVNGSQIYSLSDNIAHYFDKNAGYNEDGTWKAPTFKLKAVKDDGNSEEKTYDTVAEAFEGVGTSITNVQNKVTEQVNNAIENINTQITNVTENNLVQHDSKTEKITIGSKENGNLIDVSNKKEETRTITGVKGGTLSASSNEVVTGSQLFSTNNNVTKNTDAIKEANSKITKNATDITEANSNISSLGSNISKYLGGEANVLQGKNPSYTVQEKTYHDVGSAFAGVDSSFTNVNNKITEVENSVTNIHKEIAQKVDKNALLWSDEARAFVARHEHEEEGKEINSRITSLADGDISINSTDAVAGNQLYRLSRGVENSLGGGAKYDNGRWSPPSFKAKSVKEDGKIEESTYTNVADAFEGVGNSITNVQNKVTEQVNNVINKVEGESVVKWDEKTKSITIGKEKDGTVINLQNKDKGNRTLSGLIGGTISKDSNEAVNGSQLFETNKNITKYFGGNAKYENGTWIAPKFTVKAVNEKGTISDASYDDVTTAFAGVGTSFANFNNNITNKFKELTQNITNIRQEIQGDALLWGKDENAFVAEHGEKNSKITSLKDGVVSSLSTDAVNGSQLYSLGSEVAKSLGGNASYKDGAWTAPTFKVKGIKENGQTEDKDYTDVAAAFAGVGTSFANVAKKINKEISDAKSDSLNWNETANAFVATHGEGDAKSNSKITSLKNGDISEGSTDAVAGQQLHQLGSAVAKSLGGNAKYEGGKWSAPSFKVKTFSSDGDTKDGSYDSVSAAFEGVGTSFANVTKKITKEIENINTQITNVTENNLVQHDSKTEKITIGSKENGNLIDVSNKKEETRTITGVKGGALSADSNEAVTGSQLFATNSNVTKNTDAIKEADSKITKNVADITKANSNISSLDSNISKYLGGGASVLQGKNPSYTVQEKTYHDVGSAFAGVDSSFTNVNNKITKVENSVTNIHNEIAQKVDKNALLWSDEAQAFVARHGKKKEEKSEATATETQENSKITFLKNGDISKDSTDAINGSQLYSMGDMVAASFGGGAGYNGDGTWKAPTFKLKAVKADGKSEEKTYTNVAEAFEGVGSSITNVQNKVTEQVNNAITKVEGESVVKWDEKTKFINIGQEKDGTVINLKNKDGENRTISGLIGGVI